MLVLYAIAWFSLTQTAWGVTSKPSATTPGSRRTGINTNRVLLSVYTLAGAHAGIARCSSPAPARHPNGRHHREPRQHHRSRPRWHEPVGGKEHHRDAIGAVIVGVFRNGLTLIGVEVIYQYLVTGILVILAVSVDQLTHRRVA
jgi:fructose transport system permease protein